MPAAAAIIRRQRRTLDGIFAFDFTLKLALHVVDSVCEHVVGVRHRGGDVLHGNVVLDGEGIEDFPDPDARGMSGLTPNSRHLRTRSALRSCAICRNELATSAGLNVRQ